MNAAVENQGGAMNGAMGAANSGGHEKPGVVEQGPQPPQQAEVLGASSGLEQQPFQQQQPQQQVPGAMLRSTPTPLAELHMSVSQGGQGKV